MKRLIILFFIAFPVLQSSYSQKIYSDENLQSKSIDELNILLEKSQNIKKAGTILTFGSPLTFAAGLGLFSAGWSGSIDGNFGATAAGAGLFMIIASPVMLASGIPMLATGISRVRKIESVLEGSGFLSRMRISPTIQYNLVDDKYLAGVSLGVRF